LRPETFADALGRIVDAHHGLSFAQHWGAAERSSSDGQFFSANRGSGIINAKYGPDPGLKIYSFLSGQYGSFHSSVIGATAGEAPFVLDGLLSNPASFDPLVHYTDTGGVSDHVFALFHLLGMTFAPRLRDFPDRRLACFGGAKAWPTLSPIIGKPINEEVIRQHWGDIMRLAASIRGKSLKPSEILRKLGAYRQQNRLYLALGEIGRIERTLFMLDWIENTPLRMEKRATRWPRPSLPIHKGAFMIALTRRNRNAPWRSTSSSPPSPSGIRSTWTKLPATSRKPARYTMPRSSTTRRRSDGSTSSSPATSTGILEPQSAKLRDHCTSGPLETGAREKVR
jgi:TnpA family transposase